MITLLREQHVLAQIRANLMRAAGPLKSSPFAPPFFLNFDSNSVNNNDRLLAALAEPRGAQMHYKALIRLPTCPCFHPVASLREHFPNQISLKCDQKWARAEPVKRKAREFGSLNSGTQTSLEKVSSSQLKPELGDDNRCPSFHRTIDPSVSL